MFATLIHVALGGAIGASLRYLVGLAVAFPFGTLTVNVLGSFVIGAGLIWLTEKGLDRLWPFLMVGLLGGFTTFSTFSLDVFRLYEADRLVAALGYVVASVTLSIFAVFAGIMVARAVQI